MGDTATKLKDGVGRNGDGKLLREMHVAQTYVGDGPPDSGSTQGDCSAAQGFTERVDFYVDQNSGVIFANEGTLTTPYWTPVTVNQPNLFGVFEDFRDQSAAAAVSGTGAEVILPSGVRVFGQGIAETDSGLAVQTAGEGGNVGRMTTTDEDAHTIAIGGEAGIMQPDQHKLLVVEAEVAQVSAITLRGGGIGFVGAAADAFDPPLTFATTTATLVLDDLGLLHFSAEYTDADRWYVAHNKSDAAASQDVSAGGRDTGVDHAAAGTYERLRVEVNADGDMTCFIDKDEVFFLEDALDDDEELSPVLWLESTSTATKSQDVRRYMHYALRP